MSLETEIKKLTVAIEANTLAQLGAQPAPTAAAAKAAKPAAKPAAKKAAAKPAADDAPAATKKDIVEGIIRLAKDKGREVAAGLLAEYGATKVPDLKDESVYGEIVAKINALSPVA